MGVLGPNIQNALLGAHCVGGDGDAFEHTERERLQQHAIHERAGVAFVAIADDVLGRSAGLPNLLPLDARRETGSAPATKPGQLDLFDHLLAAHLGQGPLQRSKAATGHIRVNVQRLGFARMLHGDPLLRAQILADRRVTHVHSVSRDRLPALIVGQPVQQPGRCRSQTRAHACGPEVLPHQRLGVPGVEACICDCPLARGSNLHQRDLMAQATARYASDGHGDVQVSSRLHQGIPHMHRAAGDAA